MNESHTELAHEDVAHRAYEISRSAEAGTPEENWERAERELTESLAASAPPKRARARKKTEHPVSS